MEHQSPSDLENSPAGVAQVGWLWKESAHLRQWKKRYFVLWPATPDPARGRMLSYFGRTADKKVRKAYCLSPGQWTVERLGPRRVKEREFPGVLRLSVNSGSGSDSYLLATDDERGLDTWLAALRSESAPESFADPRLSMYAGPTSDAPSRLAPATDSADDEVGSLDAEIAAALKLLLPGIDTTDARAVKQAALNVAQTSSDTTELREYAQEQKRLIDLANAQLNKEQTGSEEAREKDILTIKELRDYESEQRGELLLMKQQIEMLEGELCELKR